MNETESQMPPAQAAHPLTWLVRGDFVNILDRLGLSLVLSTRPNHVIFIGAADGQLTFSATPMIQPLGLAAEPGRIAVATARSVAVFANVARLAAHYPGRRDYYDAFFAPRMIHFTGDCHMHDMIFAGGAIIGANTNFSCICRIDGVHSFTPLWLPSFITQLRAEDRCHLNGFAAEGGELRYVTAMSVSDVEAGWRDLPDSEGILIDTKANAVLRSDLCMPHSPRLFGNMLYMLNGGQGEVLQIDRSSGRSNVVTALPAFTHGLAAHAGIMFVGMSQDRVTRKKGPPPVMGKARAMVAGVAAIDMKSGQILGGLDFTAGVTEVYDVQTLPGIRRAGMQNLLASDGCVAVDTPNAAFWAKRPEDGMHHVQDVAASGNYHIKIRTISVDSK
ncbi:MAG: TIGR03032 family protein [Xanthobacteraceae bacterium]